MDEANKTLLDIELGVGKKCMKWTKITCPIQENAHDALPS
jgi:hypothetical protein